MMDVVKAIQEMNTTKSIGLSKLTSKAHLLQRYNKAKELKERLIEKHKELTTAPDFLDGAYRGDYIRFFESYCEELIEELEE